MSFPQPTSTHSLPEVVMKSIAELSKIASQLDIEIQQPQALVEQYKARIESIQNNIDAEVYIGLKDLLGIFIEGLDLLVLEKRALNIEECEFLIQSPLLLQDYLQLPSSKIPATILVKHFNNSSWVRPLSSEEKQVFMSYIQSHKNTHDTGAETNNDVLALIIGENKKEKQFVDAQSSEDMQSDELDLEAFIETEEIHSDNERDDEIDLLAFAASIDEEPGKPNEFQDDVLTIEDAIEIPSTPLENKADEDEIDLSAFIEDDQLDVNAAIAEVDDQQQELIDLVLTELIEVNESKHDLEKLEGDLLHQTLVTMAEQVENIGNAVKLIGLEGFHKSSGHIANNVNFLSSHLNQLNQDTCQLLDRWPNYLLGYLQNINDDNASDQLLAYLAEKTWPVQIEGDKASEINQLLKNPSFIEEEVEQRQEVAQFDDVSLELPNDVNHELLEGLLHDLPSQTEEFSAAIQNLAEGGSLEDIDVAQRIAHTLKGAANVVGVKGIANLTHHLEDILEAQSKAARLPVQSLVEMLVTAADCLEAMSEALLGLDAPPDDSISVLQSILDWANKLDKEGVPEEDIVLSGESSKERNLKLVSDTEQKNLRENIAAVENMLRVPASLADELLRLAGENLISTGQVQERIKNILKRQEVIRVHNQSLQQVSFDLEHLIDIQGIATSFNVNSEDSDFDPLEMDNYNELHSVSRRLTEIAADAVEMTQVLEDDLTELHNLVISQKQVQKENQEIVLRTRMVPIKNIIPRLKRGVRQACRITKKQVELFVEDNDTYMDSEVLNELIEPLMHVLRNAVDHGVEYAEERTQVGKQSTGTIQLSFERKGDQVVINVEDDGRGIDFEHIHDSAIKKGMVNPDIELTQEAISRLLLEPGFTTRKEVTQVSGRGIGLDVVNVKIRELKGSINIYSDYKKGSRFELVLPVSSFSTHSLLVRVRHQIYAISNRGVEEILYPGLGELCELGNETVFQIEDEVYSAVDFDALLNLSDDRRKISRSSRPILIIREESGAKTAVLVQEVIDSTDVVVKPMGQYMPKLNGIIGATILGDGSVSPVIDMPELLQNQQTHTVISPHTKLENANYQTANLPYVLVVDDSLSARRSLAQFVKDLGLDVRTARDGMEAVSLIESRKPDLLLVDMEMPKMNGLELTSHVRASNGINKMPIIMITSRSTDKHKKSAFDKGVNHFMIKPYAEDELAQHINNALKIA